MEGLTQEREFSADRYVIQPVPATAALGLATAWAGPGEATVIMPIPPDCAADRNPPAGLAAIVADAACGAALISAGAARPAVTIRLHLDLTRPLPATGHLRGSARINGPLQAGPVLVEGTVTDESREVVARCSSWWLPGRAKGVVAELTEPPGGVAPPVVTAPSLEERFGVVAEARDGRALLTARRTTAYLNRRDGLHGGVGAVLAELAADKALESIGRDPGRNLSVSVDYLAPAGLRGAPVDVEAEVVRSGRQIVIVRSTVLTAGGAPAAVATFTRTA